MIKRIFTLTEDSEAGLSGKLTGYDDKGNAIESEEVNLSKFPGNIIEKFFGPGEQTDGEYVASETAKAETILKEREEPKGKLPADFPCLTALHAASINTYGQLAKFADDYEQIAGVGPEGAKKIAEALR